MLSSKFKTLEDWYDYKNSIISNISNLEWYMKKDLLTLLTNAEEKLQEVSKLEVKLRQNPKLKSAELALNVKRNEFDQILKLLSMYAIKAKLTK